MRDTYTDVNAHKDVLVRINQIVNDPTKMFLSRGCQDDTHWVEWRENYALKHEIGLAIASRQPTVEGINAATEEIFQMMRTSL
jgi:hypothetical protein